MRRVCSPASRWPAGALILVLTGLVAAPAGRGNVLLEREQRFHAQAVDRGVVVSQEQLASEAGAAMLRRGGNAVDAAVASSFALAVTHPQAGNLGGGGFLLLWLPGRSPAAARGCLPSSGSSPTTSPEVSVGRGYAVAINFRETAPLAARADLFLASDGSVDRQLATRSILGTAVPGSVAGLTLAQRCYGRLPLAVVMAPAIALARDGVEWNRELRQSLERSAPLLRSDGMARRIFYGGGRLLQPELATTLRRIAAEGHKGFYEGPVADALVALMRERQGLISHADLSAYQARLVAPLQGRVRGHALLTMPPPGGGATVLQLLLMLSRFDLEASGLNSAASLHRMAEAMNLAFRDRNALLGDADQVALPVATLTSEAYAADLARRIDPHRHRPAAQLAAEPLPIREGENTTHLSVADREGGLVSTTTTLNFPYGNGVMVPGAGFLLNNEMDDFTAAPGSPNAFGLVQGEVNAIAPGRRPLSSMSPTLVFRPNGEPWLATGSPGGSRIITIVTQVLLNRLVHGLNLASAVAMPRIHSQLWPDRLSVEQGVSVDTLRLLEAKGHQIETSPAMGAAHSVEVVPAADGGGSLAVVDPRRPGGAAVAE